MGAERGGKEMDSQNLLSFVSLKIAFVGELLSVSLSLTSFSRSSRFDRSRSRERDSSAARASGCFSLLHFPLTLDVTLISSHSIFLFIRTIFYRDDDI